MKKLLNIDQLLDYIPLKKGTVYAYTSAGTMPHYKIGKNLFFDLDEIEMWVQEHKAG